MQYPKVAIRRLTTAVLCLGLLCGVPAAAAALPPSVVDAALETPGPFPAPPELQEAIGFWNALFLNYPSDKEVLHDKDHMSIVWQVLQLPHRPGTHVVDQEASHQVVKDAVAALKARLARLATDPTPQDDTDRQLLATLHDKGGPDADALLAGATDRVRAQQGVADKFSEGLQRSKLYLKQVRRIMRQQGVPEDVALLPFVESMYNPKAKSSVGARGVWQLMPLTAKDLGLRVNRKRDDRVDVYRASRAAGRMMRRDFKMLGSWPLAITAWNHGPNGVRRAVQAVGSSDLVTLINHYEQPNWGFSSKNFYAEFLAVVAIMHQDFDRGHLATASKTRLRNSKHL